MDLRWFFQEWVYEPGYPVYSYFWSAQEAGDRGATDAGARSGYDVDLIIVQAQDLGPTFTMPIDLVIDTDLGPETFVIWDSLRTQSFTVHVAGQPLGVELDPDEWIIRELEVMSDVADGAHDAGQTLQLSLLPNQPNPFRGTTTIGFALDRAGRVVLDIVDVNGREVARLLDGLRPAGDSRIAWSGADALGRPVSPGIYYCRVRAGGNERIQAMTLLR